ncbi:hypothetical protein QJS10_CPA08g00344 [Acorus calamus]|uniref:FRIGIDA-like protein n=1 Tax=Acorus calamus TaxID=4465 RepID=A0AAV9ECJ3_ACOCL|nr:hypothetical protein QJS10_CPA08g00344 [Acorus calamus]
MTSAFYYMRDISSWGKRLPMPFAYPLSSPRGFQVKLLYELANSLMDTLYKKEVIRDMLNNGKQIAAVDLACSFGLEDKFPPVALLQSFLRNNKETMMQMRREAHGSIAALKVANQNSLSAIKAVLKCLKDHKLDGTELSNFNMAAEVATLTKLIKIADEKLRERTMRRRTKKRDAHQLGSSRKPFTPKKRPRSGAADASYAQTPVNVPPQNSGSALSGGMNFYKHPQSSAANASYGQPLLSMCHLSPRMFCLVE